MVHPHTVVEDVSSVQSLDGTTIWMGPEIMCVDNNGSTNDPTSVTLTFRQGKPCAPSGRQEQWIVSVSLSTHYLIMNENVT